MSTDFDINDDRQPITKLLQRARNGDADAVNELSPHIYNELKKIAKHAFRGENPGHTLQPTALINQAFEKIIAVDADWQDRQHFFALSARMMRRILVDHAKAKSAAKRGNGIPHSPIEEESLSQADPNEQLLELEEAIGNLEKHDPRKAKVIELFYFGGLTHKELAEYIGVSKITVMRDLKIAETFLKQLLVSP